MISLYINSFEKKMLFSSAVAAVFPLMLGQMFTQQLQVSGLVFTIPQDPHSQLCDLNHVFVISQPSFSL